MKYLNILLFFAMIPVLAPQTRAAELKPKLEKISQKIAATASAKGFSGVTLAVFPLQVDEKLARRKVDLATSEILSYYLLKTGAFKMVERNQLNEAMKEQNLGLSGAVDSKTAANIGQVLGAKLLVMGNVIKMGGLYQVTVKLIDAITSEMISAEMAEVPVEVFDKEAELAPEFKTIGFYLAAGYGAATVTKLPPAGGATPANPDSNLLYVGMGLRYFISQKWMADAAFMPSLKFGSSSDDDHIRGIAHINGSMLRIGGDRIFGTSKKVRFHAGAGLILIGGIETAEDPFSEVILISKHDDIIIPFSRAGLEWRLRSNLGLAAFGSYNFAQSEYNFYARGTGITGQQLVRQFKSPRVIFETTLSFYFR